MNNKLDLIFEKEPPEVQQKLIGLLIQYNAMMQYVNIVLIRIKKRISFRLIYYCRSKQPKKRRSLSITIKREIKAVARKNI